MFLMKKILFHLSLLLLFLVVEDFVSANKIYDKHDFPLLDYCELVQINKIQGIAFFSSTEFWQLQLYWHGWRKCYSYIFLGKESSDKEPFQNLLLTCHCSNTSEPYFFFPASLKLSGRNVSNGIALCVRLHNITYSPNYLEFLNYYAQIPGINNTKDLYDLMAYKYSTIFHRNIMAANDLSDKLIFTCFDADGNKFDCDINGKPAVFCFDIYGKPVRMFDGIQSCAIQYLYNSSKGNDYVFKYSGPLIYGNLEYLPDDFLNTSDTAIQYKVNKPKANTAAAVDIPSVTYDIYNEQEDKLDSQYCYFHRNGTTFYSYTCVCHGEKQDNCRIPKDKRICAFDITDETELAIMKHIWIM